MVASFLRATAPVWGTLRISRVFRIESRAVEGGRRCRLFRRFPAGGAPSGSVYDGIHRGFLQRTTTIVLFTTIAFLALSSAGARAQYTPEHPEVREAITRGIQFLQANASQEQRAGGIALAGLAIAKATGDPENPAVLECVKKVNAALRQFAADDKYGEHGMYDMGLCTLFLISTDPVRYRADIQRWLALLKKYQKAHGGWGYFDRPTGDTSMTQYGALACWEAHNAKIPVAPEMANGALSWLIRTQDPSGAFGYQGKVPVNSAGLIAQQETRLTMVAAGLGSVYVLSDLFGMNGRRKDEEKDGLPSALEVVGGEEQKEKEGDHLRSSIQRDLVRAAQQRGDRYFQSNYSITVNNWQYYYIYALERYKSFQELAANTNDPSPQWYNDGVNFLLSKQSTEGAWSESGGPVVDTSFAVLFLMRSTRKSIRKARDFGAGIMLGGRGIPKDSDQLTLRDGRVVSLAEVRLTKQMIDAVGNPESIKNAEMFDAISKLPPKESRLLATKHAEKLRALLRSDSPQAKITVATALGTSGDLSNIPALILLLAEENRGVVLAARDALRRLSRRFDGFGLPDEYNEVELDTAIKAWKTWYRRIEPDVEFE